MSETLNNSPFALFEFWLAAVVLVSLVCEAFVRWRESWAKPAILVYGTVGAWYLGDLVYSGRSEFDILFQGSLLQTALLQVVLFLLSYRMFVAWVVPLFVTRLPDSPITPQLSQRVLKEIFATVLTLWAVMFVAGLWIAEWQVLAILWPPSVPIKVGMFTHPGVGSGVSFLLAATGYIYLLICSLFAVLAVVLHGPARLWAILMIAVSWPYFWFDRTRNIMLALLLPAVFCYWLFGRRTLKTKLLASVLVCIFVNTWFLGVMRYRASEESVAAILKGDNETEAKHYGLDMLKELCWMDYFVEEGTYRPNWGERYLAELANMVPRRFWPGKPMIGIDYSNLRGFGGNEESLAGVFATISTGMIGQGVANFGQFFGVLAAAVIMAAWTGLLSRLWRQRERLPRLLLFLVGCGLTFNMGRDITLLVLWPFVFGYLGVLVWENFFGGLALKTTTIRPSIEPGGGRLRARRRNWRGAKSRSSNNGDVSKTGAQPDTSVPTESTSPPHASG